jgi:hypothetical protein
MAGSSWLVDTNVLLRLVQPDSDDYGAIRQCTDLLWARGAELFYTFQNLAEFWNDRVTAESPQRLLAQIG